MDTGLCARCRWARRVRTAREVTYLRCARAMTDPTFEKYPRLPVRDCRGFEATDPPAPSTAKKAAR